MCSKKIKEFRPRPGWLARQAQGIDEDKKQWPDWMKAQSEANTTPRNAARRAYDAASGALEAAVTGMNKAAAAASPEWLEDALAAVTKVARKRLEFTADDVWKELGGKDGGGSAIGPVLQRASQIGIIRNSGQFIRSERTPTHGRPITLWRSRIFGVRPITAAKPPRRGISGDRAA